MFGIDDILIGAAIGGAMGGLTNRKKPLQGALMGAGLGGLGGGLLGPAMGAGSSVGPATGSIVGSSAEATAFPVLNAAGAIQQGAALPITQAAPMGGLLSESMGLVKNAGTVMSAANQANQMAGGNQPQMPISPSPVATPMPNNNLGQLVASYQQNQQAQQQMEQQARLAKRKLYGYGVA